MKKIITTLLMLFFTISISNSGFSQVNSVALNGNFIYGTISAAYAAMGGSIASPQVIALSSSYNGSLEVFPISLTAVTGASATNTITIRPNAGANSLVLSGALNDGLIRFNNCSFVILDGRPGGVISSPANYLSVNNTLTGVANTSAHAVLFNTATDCRAQYLNANCALGTASFAGARGVISIGGSVITTSSVRIVVNNNIMIGGQRGFQNGGAAGSNSIGDTIRNNEISQFFALGLFTNFSTGDVVKNNKVYYSSAITTAAAVVAIQIQGNSSTIDQNEAVGITSANAATLSHFVNFGANNVITNNNLHNPVATATITQLTGVQFSGSGNTQFSGNQIHDFTGSSATVFVIGISTADNGTATDATTISSNKIFNLESAGAANIRGMSCFPRPGNTLNIQNNFVSITQTNSLATGIFGILIGTAIGAYSPNVYFNSVRIGGNGAATTASFTAALYIDSLAPTSVINSFNNIATNDRIGGTITSFFVGYDLTAYPEVSVTLASDNNLAMSTDTTVRGWDGGYDGSYYRFGTGLELYHAATCSANIEQLTDFDITNFVSNTDLHLAGPIGTNMAAQNIGGITTDIDGTSRAITGTNLFTYKGADEHLPTGGAAWRKSIMNITLAFQGANFVPNVYFGTIVTNGTTVNLYADVKGTLSGSIYSAPLYCGDLITSTSTTNYLEVGYINSIRTFSANPVSFASTTNSYNFSTAITQAYGSNMSGTSAPFAIYQGDISQDDIVDAADLSAVENEQGIEGCRINSDVNIDEITDAGDLAIVENNQGVETQIPPGLSSLNANRQLDAIKIQSIIFNENNRFNNNLKSVVKSIGLNE